MVYSRAVMDKEMRLTSQGGDEGEMSVQSVRDCERGGKKKGSECGCDWGMRAPNNCMQELV